MKKTTLNAAAIGLALLPLVFLAVTYPHLPQNVPMHFGADLKPNRWGDKSELWFVTCLISLLSIGVYFLFQNLHKIDPKHNGHQTSPVFFKLGLMLLVFMALLNFFVIGMVKGDAGSGKVLFPLLGLLFAFMGNYMNNIKPNYFAGFRLPWTLSSDDNWRKTHHLGGRLWFGGGLLIAIVCPFLPVSIAFYFFMAVMSAMVCIPLVYSYRLFKHNQQSL